MLKKINSWGDRIQYWLKDQGSFTQSTGNKENIIVYSVSVILAFGLWLMVNLNRDYTYNIEIPIENPVLPAGYALIKKPLSSTLATVRGEGWGLITLKDNPPVIRFALQEKSGNQSINLLENIRNEMVAHPNVELVKVEPSLYTITLEERITKSIPVNNNVVVTFQPQHHFVSEPTISPDSIMISGAVSVLKNIEIWNTEPLTLSVVKDDIDIALSLESAGDLIDLDRNVVRFRANVSEYTEGEIRVFVRTESAPKNVEIRYNPSVITIKYDVPIDEYAAAQETVPYRAYVPYREVMRDTTGFITPVIENVTPELNLKVRSYQPQSVSYFRVVNE